MSTPKSWINIDVDAHEGLVGFLVERVNETEGWSKYEVRDRPAHTNVSRKPVLHGWCGSYNNVSTYGCGFVMVYKVLPNGRVKVRELTGEELAEYLESFGYPELIPQEEAELL